MEKALLIVESPAKARTLWKFLGSNFKVKASMGHVKNLPQERLGVDIKNDFRPQYVIIKGRKKIIQELKKAAKEVDVVYLGPDPDREGEAIAWHIADELENKEIYRAIFHELTKSAVREAIKAHSPLDLHKYESQQARRILDRLVGYQISPILWKNVGPGLSAGRVQSVAVRIICNRERTIQKFVPQEYWTITARLEGKNPPPFEAKLIMSGKEKIQIGDENSCQDILSELRSQVFKVIDIKKKEVKRYPRPPFTTSTLQQEANWKLRFTAKKTMGIAQRLYEGIELGDKGAVGLITYMRTDSVRLSQGAIHNVRAFLKERFGMDYVPARPNIYKNKKGIQDAHEAIRPTHSEWTPEEIGKYLTSDQLALYTLIWKRFLASQMSAQILDQTSIDIEAGTYILRATCSDIKFPGFTVLYVEEEDRDAQEKLPHLTPGEILKLLELKPEQHFTEPPHRFTEATLVKELEENGIGRPSTYAIILSTIQERNYVKKVKGRFYPTELGFLVTDLLVNSFPDLMDVKFTAQMEDRLDKIEEGILNWVTTLEDFYGPFSEDLGRAKVDMKRVKSKGLPTEISCKKCGQPMVIRWGKAGEFLACSSFPVCSNTESFIRDEKGAIKIVDAKPISIGMKCPQPGCEGDVVERRSRKGKIFFGCSKYPTCKFVSWNRPVPEACPRCEAPFLVTKYSQKRGDFLACPDKECGYKKAGEDG